MTTQPHPLSRLTTRTLSSLHQKISEKIGNDESVGTDADVHSTKDQDVEHETEAGVDDDEGGEHIDLYEVSCKVAEMVRIGSESDHT